MADAATTTGPERGNPENTAPALSERELLSALTHLRLSAELEILKARPDYKQLQAGWRARRRWERRWQEEMLALLEHIGEQIGIDNAIRFARGSRKQRVIKDVPTQDEVAMNMRHQVDEQAWLQGAQAVYIGLARETGATAGQFTLDALGVNKTFAWATERDFPAQLFSVRGSKVVQQMYGQHIDRLAKLVTDKVHPTHPTTIGDLTRQIHDEWPKLERWQAARIARTEAANAWETTHVNAMRMNGVKNVTNIVATGPAIGVDQAEPCEYCIEQSIEIQDVPLAQLEDIPPWHPNCRCELIPELADDWLPPDEPWTGQDNPLLAQSPLPGEGVAMSPVEFDNLDNPVRFPISGNNALVDVLDRVDEVRDVMNVQAEKGVISSRYMAVKLRNYLRQELEHNGQLTALRQKALGNAARAKGVENQARKLLQKLETEIGPDEVPVVMPDVLPGGKYLPGQHEDLMTQVKNFGPVYTANDAQRLGGLVERLVREEKQLVETRARAEATEKLLKVKEDEVQKYWEDHIRSPGMSRPTPTDIQDEYSRKTDEYYQLKSEAEAVRQAVNSASTEAMRLVLSQIRDLGGEVKAAFVGRFDAEEVEGRVAFERAMRNVPTDWIERAGESDALYSKPLTIKIDKYSRAYYSPAEGMIITDTTTRTMVHEMMHRMEATEQRIMRVERQFHEMRTSGESLRTIPGYNTDERGYLDKYVNPYMGKDYSPRGFERGSSYEIPPDFYEILSMGSQDLFDFASPMWQNDPDFARFILGIWAGM